MHLLERGVICDSTQHPENERIAFFGGLTVLKSGTALALCQLGPAKHAPTSTLALFRSRDAGRTWEKIPVRFASQRSGVPGSFGSGQIQEVEPGRLLLVATWYDRCDPARPLFDPVTEGLLASRQLKAFSVDEGSSWSEWEEISTGGLKGCSSTGPLLQWSDGLLAYPFESLKQFNDPTSAVPGAWCVLSRDGGKTFGSPVLIARDSKNERYFWDQRLSAARTPGHFIALFWTHDVAQKSDLTIHLRKAGLANSVESTPPVDTGLEGQIAAPLLLEDGRLLAFIVERNRPGRMILRLSPDGGTSWPESVVVYTHEERAALSQGADNIDYAEYWEDMYKWTFGHPAIRALSDGSLLLSYYAGVPNCLSLFWAKVGL